MSSLNSLIILILAWITNSGVLIVLYFSLFLTAIPIWAVVMITAILVGGALGVTWLVLRQPTRYQADYQYE